MDTKTSHGHKNFSWTQKLLMDTKTSPPSLACASNLTVATYCERIPTTPGCSSSLCCQDNIAKCNACRAGLDIPTYCYSHPGMEGCPTICVADSDCYAKGLVGRFFLLRLKLVFLFFCLVFARRLTRAHSRTHTHTHAHTRTHTDGVQRWSL